MPADHLPDDDPDDVVGAVMSATDEVPSLPGVRVVTEASQAQLLQLDRGDELLDWSPDPVIVDFGTGCGTARRTRPTEDLVEFVSRLLAAWERDVL
jgi:hypothetical protein